MKETVAIIGSHPKTRGDFDWSRTDADIWGFNEALNTDWFDRADGIFQIHKPVIWRSKTNRNDPKHYAWLKSGDTPIIFMQDDYTDVPKAERYPLEDALALAPGIGYFTSSVAYAIALAILKGYKRIEVYGVEMETNTEYGHQRVGVAFWCGYAMGRGIELDFHSPTFFSAPLYGYDGDVKIPLEFYNAHLQEARKHGAGAKAKQDEVQALIDGLMAEFIKSYKTNMDDLDTYIFALRDNAQFVGMAEGVAKVCQRYLDNCTEMIEESDDYLVVRQEIEGQGIAATKAMPDADRKMRRAAEILQKKRAALNTNANKDRREKLVDQFNKVLRVFVASVARLGMLKGAININRILMKKYDDLLQASGINPQESQAIPAEEPEAVPA